MNIEKFKKAFKQIKQQGFVKSSRRGPTGIGHTLEKLLKLKENNIALPDLGKIELKAHRIGSSSMITLFTFNRKAWRMNPLEAIRKYGTPDKNGRLGLYFTMSRTPNSSGLFLHLEVSKISVRHISGEIIAEWKFDDLATQFIRKLPALILVSAFSEMRGEEEWFKYSRAQLLYGTSSNVIRNQIESDGVMIDFRATPSNPNADSKFLVRNDKLCWSFEKWSDL